MRKKRVAKPETPPVEPTAYQLKLRDPRWQRKRLEILHRDDFKCQACGETEKELHVHHVDYVFGRDPWDYEDGFLQTLCAPCHEREKHRRGLEQAMLKFFRHAWVSTDMLASIPYAFQHFRRGGAPLASFVAAAQAERDGTNYEDELRDALKTFSEGGDAQGSDS